MGQMGTANGDSQELDGDTQEFAHTQESGSSISDTQESAQESDWNPIGDTQFLFEQAESLTSDRRDALHRRSDVAPILDRTPCSEV
jgi:hypothetical protein